MDVEFIGEITEIEVIALPDGSIRACEVHWYEAHGIGSSRIQGQEDPDVVTTRANGTKDYVLCLSNRGYDASLVVRRLYELVPDPEAEKRGLLRVVDESGEDYLFPRDLFAVLDLPIAVRERLTT